MMETRDTYLTIQLPVRYAIMFNEIASTCGMNRNELARQMLLTPEFTANLEALYNTLLKNRQMLSKALKSQQEIDKFTNDYLGELNSKLSKK